MVQAYIQKVKINQYRYYTNLFLYKPFYFIVKIAPQRRNAKLLLPTKKHSLL